MDKMPNNALMFFETINEIIKSPQLTMLGNLFRPINSKHKPYRQEI